jgi:hypothetical protein
MLVPMTVETGLYSPTRGESAMADCKGAIAIVSTSDVLGRVRLMPHDYCIQCSIEQTLTVLFALGSKFQDGFG